MGTLGNLNITTTELYGFMTWIVSALATIFFIVWAIAPDYIMKEQGLYFLPNKYYVNAFTNWLGVTIVVENLIVIGMSLSYSYDRESYLTMQDKFTKL